LPIIIGVAAGVSGLNLSQTILAYLQSIVINQTQAAIRLSVVGQKAAAEILAQLETTITNTAADAQDCTLDDLGTSTIMAEIMAMQHEELQGRMFRS